MGKPCSVMVGFGRQKDLRFVLESSERLAMNYAVAVALIAGAYFTFLFGDFPALRIYAECRPVAQNKLFIMFGYCSCVFRNISPLHKVY